MAVTTSTFNSEGGFGVKQKTIISDSYDLLNVNSIQLQNSEYTDCKRSTYILKGFNTSILSRSQQQNLYIPIERESIAFITAHAVATNETNSGQYAVKIEASVQSDASGDISLLSFLKTVIADNVPFGESWEISVYTSGNVDELSLSSIVGGNSSIIKWISNVEIVTVAY